MPLFILKEEEASLLLPYNLVYFWLEEFQGLLKIIAINFLPYSEYAFPIYALRSEDLFETSLKSNSTTPDDEKNLAFFIGWANKFLLNILEIIFYLVNIIKNNVNILLLQNFLIILEKK